MDVGTQPFSNKQQVLLLYGCRNTATQNAVAFTLLSAKQQTLSHYVRTKLAHHHITSMERVIMVSKRIHYRRKQMDTFPRLQRKEGAFVSRSGVSKCYGKEKVDLLIKYWGNTYSIIAYFLLFLGVYFKSGDFCRLLCIK